jgi:hypothetical protein
LLNKYNMSNYCTSNLQQLVFIILYCRAISIRDVIKVNVKVKLSLCLNWAARHEGVLGEWMYSSTHSLTSALDGGEWSASRPGRFTLREKAPGTHCIGGWVGPRTGLKAVVKRKIPSPRRESNPRTPIVQPVAQQYTDWTITVLRMWLMYTEFWELYLSHGDHLENLCVKERLLKWVREWVSHSVTQLITSGCSQCKLT